MRAHTKNLIVDILGFVFAICLVVTGFVMEFVLPHGPQNRGKNLLGFTRHDWGEVHFIFGIAFVVFMLLHLYLHWNWIKASLLRRDSK